VHLYILTLEEIFGNLKDFRWGDLPSMGGASGRATDAGFTRRTGAEGGENPLRLLLAAPGTF
jgi:hypothetical protein